MDKLSDNGRTILLFVGIMIIVVISWCVYLKVVDSYIDSRIEKYHAEHHQTVDTN